MRRFTFTAALLATILSGCAQFRGDPQAPQIEVLKVKLVGGTNGAKSLLVDPPVFLFKSGPNLGEVVIEWRLEKDSGLSFDRRRGVFIDGEVKEDTQIQPLIGLKDSETPALQRRIQSIDPTQKEIGLCKVSEDGLTYTCVNKRSRPGHFKYTLRINDSKNQYILDPDGWNW
jgi:hypothetical protein